VLQGFRAWVGRSPGACYGQGGVFGEPPLRAAVLQKREAIARRETMGDLRRMVDRSPRVRLVSAERSLWEKVPGWRR
jgi:hypothetical protein